MLQPTSEHRIFNPFTTHIGRERYLPLKTASSETSRHLWSRFGKLVVSDKGNPDRMGYTGRAKGIKVKEPKQLKTKKKETKPQLTEDHTGPAAGPSPKASGGKAAKKIGTSVLRPGKKIGAFTTTRGLWIPHRPANVSREEWLLRYGAKNRPDND